MINKNEWDYAARARQIIQHQIDALGTSEDMYANSAGIEPKRLKAFLSGTLASLTEAESQGLGDLAISLGDAEDRDWQETPKEKRWLTASQIALGQGE
jgi:hypothetical protein